MSHRPSPSAPRGEWVHYWTVKFEAEDGNAADRCAAIQTPRFLCGNPRVLGWWHKLCISKDISCQPSGGVLGATVATSNSPVADEESESGTSTGGEWGPLGRLPWDSVPSRRQTYRGLPGPGPASHVQRVDTSVQLRIEDGQHAYQAY